MATTATTNSTTGAGLIQSLGIGSGLNVQSLVTQLVAADRAPAAARITRQATSVGTSISALGTLKGALASFQSALGAATTSNQFQSMSTHSADDTVFTATAGSGAVAGSYGLEVRQLAQPEQLISTSFAGGASSVVGSGTMQVSLGSSSFNVTIGSDTATLADVRDAINTASGNPGVKATLVYGLTGAQLVLTSATTGAGNAIRATVTGASGSLANLSYSGAADTHYTESQAPQDAIIFISGVEHHSASNVVAGAIDGVTLSLKAAKPNTTLNLDISDDQSTVIGNVTNLVTAYNSMQSQLRKLGSYDAASKTGGPLVGDWLLKNTQYQVNNGMTNPVAGLTGPYSSLAALGITTDANGQLVIDSTKLTAALTADSGSVAKLFGGTNGIGKRLDAALTGMLADTGAIAARDANLTQAQKDVTTQQTALDAQMAVVQQRYLTQFNALDSLMSQLQSTSNYLTQQLANIASIGNGSSTKSG